MFIIDGLMTGLFSYWTCRTTSTLQATAGAEDVMVVLQVTNLHDASYGAQLNLSVNSSLLVFSKTVNRDPRLWCDHIPTGAFCRVGFPLRTDDSVNGMYMCTDHVDFIHVLSVGRVQVDIKTSENSGK